MPVMQLRFRHFFAPIWLCAALVTASACSSNERTTADAGAHETVIASTDELAHLLRNRPTVIAGDLTIGGDGSNLSDVTLGGIVEIQGSLTIARSSSLTRVALPQLQHLGDLEVYDNAMLQTLELPALVDTEGLYVLNNAVLTVLTFPALTSAIEVVLQKNLALKTLTAPKLAQVAATARHGSMGLQVSDNAVLEELSLPTVTQLASLTVQNDDALRLLSFAALEHVVGPTILTDNYVLQSISMPSLAELGSDTFDSLFEVSAPLLVSLDLPALTRVNELILDRCLLLRSLTLPKLTGVGEMIPPENLAVFEAAELTSIGALSDFSLGSLRTLSLPLLTQGCAQFERIPDCEIANALPSCPETDVLRFAKRGCVCSSDHDLQAARCPDPFATDAGRALLDGSVDGAIPASLGLAQP